MSPESFVNSVMGKSYDFDNYPPSQKYQCLDLFTYFLKLISCPCSISCALTNYAGDLWVLRDRYGYGKYFDFITEVSEIRNGDWVFWNKHVAMYFDGYEVGQNQGSLTQPKVLHPYVTRKTFTKTGILGAMRWKNWDMQIPYFCSDPSIHGHIYHLFRGRSTAYKFGVLSAGLNRVAKIRDLDAEGIWNYCKITGANYFQNRTDLPDHPYGETYGDISAPLNGVCRSLPNQSTTLYYDMDTDDFGDCTGVCLNKTHNVFSPSLVYPNKNGRFEYAVMVGLGILNIATIYAFALRMSDGWTFGINEFPLTPQDIKNDFLETDMKRIIFLDGGGSAQMGRYENGRFRYLRDTGRECPSALTMYRSK